MAALIEGHARVQQQTCYRGCLASTAVVVAGLALAVILCAGLCCALSGVNCITEIVLPAIVPAIIALACTTPCFAALIRARKTRQELIGEAKRLLEELPLQGREAIKQYVLDNLLPADHSYLYDAQFLQDLKKAFPKEREQTEAQKNLCKGIDLAITAVADRTREIEG